MKKIAVLGPKGTFSDNASEKYLELLDYRMEKVYFPTIDDAFRSVGNECDYGIIPIENTLDGYVQRTLDLLMEMNVHIIKENIIPIQFSLIANTKDINGIKKLFVQFKTNGQCRKFITSLQNINTVTTESNMESYYRIKDGVDGEAAIIPQHMLQTSIKNFSIKNITDSENNYTRFIIIEPNTITNTVNDSSTRIKIPLYITPETDKPGILFECLKEFSENKINLVSIMSRPTKKEMGTYNFFIEIDGAYEDKNKILEALKMINESYTIKILGIYSV